MMTSQFQPELPLPDLSDFHEELASRNDDSPKIMGLTTKEEQIWCEYYCRKFYRNRGEIIELGPWLGSLTKCLQNGLCECTDYLQNPRPVNSYDRFEWEPWCEDQVKGTELEKTIPMGASFMSIFLSLTKHPKVPLSAHKVDLHKEFPVPDRIELLINDAIKNWVSARRFASQFLVNVIQGGCVAHQDFLWPTEAFLVPLMYHFRDHFEGRYIVPGSCMGVFIRTSQQAPLTSLLKTLPHANGFSLDTIRESFDWTLSTIEGVEENIAHLCQATLLWKMGLRAEAAELVALHQLARIDGSPLFNFQRQILKNWGFREIFQ